MTKHVALYLRQSKSDTTGNGPDRQLERTRLLAEARGWTVTGTYLDDGVSASKARGSDTAWGRMLADADAGRIDTVIGVDLDRLLRSTRDLNTLIDHGLAVVTVDGEIDLSTADGEFRATMLAGIARFEARRKGERQSRANAHRAKNGGVPKGPHLHGYTSAGDVIPDEAITVRALFEGFAAGETIKGLSRTHDMPPSSIRTMLTNGRYAGRRTYGGNVYDGKWEPIVSEQLFDAVNLRLADPARITNRTGSTSRKHLGTSLYRCDVCDDHPTLRTAGSGNRYWCPSCGLVRTMAPVDEYVRAHLWGRLTMPDARSAFAPRGDAEPLLAEVAELRGRRGVIARMIAAGKMSERDADDALTDLDRQIAALDQRIGAIGSPVSGITDEEIVGGLEALSQDRQRALIETLMDVRLRRGVRGSRAFDPDSVLIVWK